MNHQIIPGLLLSAAAQEKMQLPKAVCEQICGSQFWGMGGKSNGNSFFVPLSQAQIIGYIFD